MRETHNHKSEHVFITDTKIRKNAESVEFPKFLKNKYTVLFRPFLEAKDEIGLKV